MFGQLVDGVNCNPICVPFYVYHKMLAGMLDMYNRVGSKQALQVATGMAAWYAAFIAHAMH